MNKKIDEYLAMCESTNLYLDTHREVYAANEAVVKVKDELAAKIVKANDLKVQQSGTTKLETAAKTTVKDFVVDKALLVIRGLNALGVERNDVRLMTLCKVRPSALQKMKEGELVLKLRELYSAAAPEVEALKIWNVKQEDIDDLGASTEDYKSISPKIRNIKVTSTSATDLLKRERDELEELFQSKLDIMLSTYSQVKPDFYNGYLKVRAVVSRSSGRSKSTAKSSTDTTTDSTATA